MTPDKACALLNDLNMLKLEVILVPSKRPEEALRGGTIRCVVCPNPGWYSKLCSAHVKQRTRRSMKPDTRIVRRDVIRLLTRVADSKPVKSYIVQWLDNNV